SLGDYSSQICCSVNVIGLFQLSLHRLFNGGSCNQGVSNGIVDNLSIHMIIASEHSKTRSLRCAAETVTQSSVLVHTNFLSRFLTNHFHTLLISYFLPVLPTLRLIVSSAYLIPLPL